MKMRNLALESLVVVACYLILTIPLTSATSVNIIFNGQVQQTVQYEPSDVVNQHITYVRDPRDINWANVRVAMRVNSASLAHSIKRVYLYKCGSLTPVGCMQKTPEVFDNYVDTEIAWTDIGQSTGSTKYPQEGNLLFLIKLEDPDGFESWMGLWNNIKRTSHREFFFYRHELSDLEVHAESANIVGPIASYIENYNMIPFKWLTKAVFDDAISIFAIGGDDSELETSPPIVQAVEPSSTTIDVINKENYLVFPVTSSGVNIPISLELNPEFQCGDGKCESNLGESHETCCYDCKCLDSNYCDVVQGSPETGVCKNEDLISLEVVGTPSSEITDCSQSFDVGVTARISSLPVSMSESVSGEVRVDGTPYSATCTLSSPGLYECRFTVPSNIQCGKGSISEGPNELRLTITYNDGENQVTRDLVESFPTISLRYDCSCPSGLYCDTGAESCQAEDAITLGITELTSYLDAYTPGDTIDLTAKIFNPPTGAVLVSASAGLNLTNGIVSPGTPQCSGPSEDFEYTCSIPFSITGYQRSTNYKFFPNVLSFQVTYNDGPTARTTQLSTEFGPISIPSQECGNDVCDVEEDSTNCCQDCGCPGPGEYCDLARGCASLNDVSLSVVPFPTELEDCKAPNEVNIQATIENAPYDTRLDYKAITVNNQPVPWKFECPETGNVGGVFSCLIEIPPIEGCELPYYSVGPNKLTFTITFPNGDDPQSTITRELNSSFADIQITPIPHKDGICEPSLGENGSTACVDCPCLDDPAFGEEYYCDAGEGNPTGICLLKSGVSLVIESPLQPVNFNSCEDVNKVSVLMHVKNQPSGMDIENTFATVGGEAARYLNCYESFGGFLESNITLNCTIGLPPITTCSQGQTYNFSDNSISVVISYNDGNPKKVLQTLSADLPDFFITQDIRSLYDITEEAMDQMRAVLDNIMTLTEQLAESLMSCIKMQMVVFIAGMVMTIAMGLLGGGVFSKGNQPFDFQGFGEGIRTGGEMTSQFNTIAGKMCDIIQKWGQIEIEMQRIQIEKIKMNLCLGIIQHKLDRGDCRGEEEGCFDQVVNCLGNLNEITNIVEDIGKLTEGIGKDFAQMGNAVAEAGDAFADGPWSYGQYGRNEYLSVGIRGGDSYYYQRTSGLYSTLSPTGAVLCKYSESQRDYFHGGNCIDTMLIIRKSKPRNCEYSYVSFGPSGGNLIPLPLQGQPKSSEYEQYSLRDIPTEEINYKINLHCSRREQVNVQKDRIIESVEFYVAKSRPYDFEGDSKRKCQCTWKDPADGKEYDFRGAKKFGDNNYNYGAQQQQEIEGKSGCGLVPDEKYLVIEPRVMHRALESGFQAYCKIPQTEGMADNSVVTPVGEPMFKDGYEYWKVEIVQMPPGTSGKDQNCRADVDTNWIRACKGQKRFIDRVMNENTEVEETIIPTPVNE
jgi:hypothetical protein